MMESIKKPTLRFRADGTFKILQLTDLHIGTLTGSLSGRNMTALNLIDTLIAAEKPDLVAFTGDISTDGSNGHICRIWDEINAILEKHNTPYTMTFGNHESDAHTNRPQAIGDHLEKYPLSLFECGDPNMGTGNYAVPVLASDNDKTAWLLYSIDCHSSQFPFPYPDGHKETREWYTWPTQLKWIEKTQKAAQAEFGSVPAIAFNHVPLPEYDEMWMFDGTISGNECGGLYGGGLYVGSFAYIGGGKICENIMHYYSSNPGLIYGGDAICVFDGVLYLCGGEIYANPSWHNGGETSHKSAAKEIFIRSSNSNRTAKVYLGSSVTLSPEKIPSEVQSINNVVVDSDSGIITTSNPLKMENNDGRNFMYYCQYKVDGTTSTFYNVQDYVILMNDLPAGSKVVFGEKNSNSEAIDYFLTLDESYTTPSAATLNAICLAGADALYNAELTGAGTELAWPSAGEKPYQIIVSAFLDGSIGFRVTFARRDAT
ncbi:MAG: metallophosphoesterase, partial [Clostridia bacterium]|nr:metallophosphoesterase [Clostridia bacterium]